VNRSKDVVAGVADGSAIDHRVDEAGTPLSLVKTAKVGNAILLEVEDFKTNCVVVVVKLLFLELDMELEEPTVVAFSMEEGTVVGMAIVAIVVLGTDVWTDVVGIVVTLDVAVV